MRPSPLIVTALLVALAASAGAAACAPTKQRRCERYAKDGLGLVMGIANGVARGLGGDDMMPVELGADDRKRAIAKIIEECMTWPDDFVRCMTDGDWESTQCREAYARKEGLVVRVDGAPGPAPTRREIGRDDDLACAGGRCFLNTGDQIERLAMTGDGAAKLADGELVGVSEVGGQSFVITAKDGEVTLVGATTTKVAAPRPAPDDPLATPLAASAKGLVLFDDGRVRRLVAPPCESCFERTPWHFEGYHSAFDYPELYEVRDGILYYSRDKHSLTLLGADGSLRFALRADSMLGEPLVVDERVYLTVEAEALGLDLGQCRSDHALALEDLTAPCVTARMTLSEADGSRPQRLGERVYFLANDRVHELVAGKKGWVAEVEADTFLALEYGGTPMLFAATRWTMDHPARLIALDPATGMTLMHVDVDGEHGLWTDLERDADRLVMRVSTNVFSWDLGALKAAITNL